jgi:hydroxyacylglutathione hydrolase
MISIAPIPALESNYFWVIQPNTGNPSVYVVDPGDAVPVINYLNRHQLSLTAILITHRHRDHTGGINDLLKHWSVPVYGPESELIPQITHPLKDGDELHFEGLDFTVIAVPGHTWEHIVYFAPAPANLPPLLFCGDALFAGGCGRRFDGTAEIMWQSLEKLAALPDSTQVYCAHEYTQVNLEFAAAVEPSNTETSARLEQVNALRAQGQITLPSTILEEKRTNPYLRCQQAGIKIFVEHRLNQQFETTAEVFGALRLIKDSW